MNVSELHLECPYCGEKIIVDYEFSAEIEKDVFECEGCGKYFAVELQCDIIISTGRIVWPEDEQGKADG